MIRHFVAFVAFAVSVAPPLSAQSAGPKAMLTVQQVESKIVPRMAGFDYLGAEIANGGAAFRLKFQRGSRAVWIDVDRVTGKVINTSGGPPSAPSK